MLALWGAFNVDKKLLLLTEDDVEKINAAIYESYITGKNSVVNLELTQMIIQGKDPFEIRNRDAWNQALRKANNHKRTPIIMAINLAKDIETRVKKGQKVSFYYALRLLEKFEESSISQNKNYNIEEAVSILINSWRYGKELEKCYEKYKQDKVP